MGGVTKNHPKGTETTIHGLPTYVAQPDEGVTPKAIIVFLTDAFGWKFPNNRVLCDHYAKIGGFLVYCPDFMFGTFKPTDRCLFNKHFLILHRVRFGSHSYDIRGQIHGTDFVARNYFL
jgi:dienelactone hydrolase